MKTLLKKKSVRFLSLLLAAALILPLALPASAASVTWTEGNKKYTLTISPQTREVKFLPANMPSVTHRQGTDTTLIALSNYTFNVKMEWDRTPTGSLYSKALDLLDDLNLSTGKTFTIPLGKRITVPGSEPSGQYVICMPVYVVSGNWSAKSVNGELVTLEGSGSFSNAYEDVPNILLTYTYVKVG